MTLPRCLMALAAFAGLGAAPAAELDCAANARLLDTHFARYGPAPARSVYRESDGVRFRLPRSVKGQVGLYSYFALAGDFEVSATFDWTAVAAPQGGYGVSCGLAADAQAGGTSVALARGHLPGRRQGYVVTRGHPGDAGTQYETSFYATSARRGRLALRREQAEVVCLAADGPQEPLRELCRVPFSEGTVRPLRLFADPGGSPTGLDAWLGRLRVRADEIAGGAPKHEAAAGLGWWPAAAAVPVAAAVALRLVRRKRRD